MARTNCPYSSDYLVVEDIINEHLIYSTFLLYISVLLSRNRRKRKRCQSTQPYTLIDRIPHQVHHMNRLVGITDIDCVVNLRMDRNTFGRLCMLLRHVGELVDGKYVTVEEQVAMFLSILAHHKKNRIVRFNFWCSGQTISHYVHVVLKAILKLHDIFLVKPEPVPDDCTDPRWKWFKGCLGALDGTYINVMVSNEDKPRYRTRNGQISTNTLAVCDRKMRFVYVLAGWEGSAGDARILRDAVNRVHGLKIPRGNYYLCDNGYANSEGFLTPYKGVRYHLKEWGAGTQRPQNPQEMFNMRHTKARNVIERAFGVMKMHWGILRTASYYPIKIQNRLIMACFLLHNFIRGEMSADPIEQQMEVDPSLTENEEEHDDVDFVDGVETTTEWARKRDDLAHAMWLHVQDNIIVE